MNTASNLYFNTAILPRAAARHQAVSQAQEAVPASLWRQARTGDNTRTAVRGFYGVMAVAGLASVVWAGWQTVALVAGDHLQNAVLAFFR